MIPVPFISIPQLEERVARLSAKGAIAIPINGRHREIVGNYRKYRVTYTAFVMIRAVYCHTKSSEIAPIVDQ